jgi:hypothetical protein
MSGLEGSAKPDSPDSFRIGVRSASEMLSSSSSSAPRSGSITLPQFELGARFGVAENFDIGAKPWILGARREVAVRPERVLRRVGRSGRLVHEHQRRQLRQ